MLSAWVAGHPQRLASIKGGRGRNGTGLAKHAAGKHGAGCRGTSGPIFLARHQLERADQEPTPGGGGTGGIRCSPAGCRQLVCPFRRKPTLAVTQAQLPPRSGSTQALNRLDFPVCDGSPSFTARAQLRTRRRRTTHRRGLRRALRLRARDRRRCPHLLAARRRTETRPRPRACVTICARWTAPPTTRTTGATGIAALRRTALPVGSGTSTRPAASLAGTNRTTICPAGATGTSHAVTGTMRSVRPIRAGAAMSRAGALRARMLVGRATMVRRPMSGTPGIDRPDDDRWRPVVAAAVVAIGIAIPAVIAAVGRAMPDAAIHAVTAAVSQAAVGRAVMTIGRTRRTVVVIAVPGAIPVGRTSGERHACDEQKGLADHGGHRVDLAPRIRPRR